MTSSKQPFRIFISHNVDNHKYIAQCLQEQLLLLSKGIVQCEVCTQTPGGTEWRKWIQREVSRCDLFLYVYTSDCVRQEWLLFEAGVFLGARQQQQADKVNGETGGINSALICLKSPGIPTPPKPIEHLQAYEADETNLRRFFIDLLVKHKFNPSSAINDKLLSDYDRQLGTAINEIEEAFAQSSIESVYYRRRLEVGPIDPKTFDHLKENKHLVIPPDTPVEVSELARDMIGLPELENHTWAHLHDKKDEDHVWIDELQEVVREVFNDRPPQQFMTPFNSPSHQVCNPIVSRIDRVQRKVHKLYVLLVEHKRVENADDLTDALQRAPARFRTMVRMMNLTRRTRWNVIEPFRNQISAPGSMQQDISIIAQEFNDSLARLEAEAFDAGWLNVDNVKLAFDVATHGPIEELFRQYENWRDEFNSLLQSPDKQRLTDLVEQFTEINKRFWLIALDRYEELVNELAPKSVNSAMSTLRMMARAEVWEDVLGNWEGVARDVNIPGLLTFEQSLEYQVTMNLERCNRCIGGTLKLKAFRATNHTDHYSAEAQLEGVFAHRSYFGISYRVEKPGSRHFGIMLVKLADTENRIRGLFLSKKAVEEDTLGFGQVVMVRQGAGIDAKFTRTPEWMCTVDAGATTKEKLPLEHSLVDK